MILQASPRPRYTLIMPAGTSFVVYNDGVLCMQPTTRTGSKPKP